MKNYIALRLSNGWYHFGTAGWGIFIGKGWIEPRYYVWCHARGAEDSLYFLDGSISDDYMIDQVIGDASDCTEFGSAEELRDAMRLFSDRAFREEFGVSKRQAEKLLAVCDLPVSLSPTQIVALIELLTGEDASDWEGVHDIVVYG